LEDGQENVRVGVNPSHELRASEWRVRKSQNPSDKVGVSDSLRPQANPAYGAPGYGLDFRWSCAIVTVTPRVLALPDASVH
jgi:hypothetical protein